MFNYTEITKNIEFQRINEIFENKLHGLENKNLTSRLWVSCCEIVSLLKDFIAAECMGDWNLHLHTIERMIPYFHASGHFAYAKSAQMYFQNMQELPTKMNPEEFKKFIETYFTARRSDVFFSRISTNQTIEQTLIKSMSVEEMLFKRGVTESIDVNVLVLLTALSPTDREIYFQNPGKGKVPQKVYSSNSLETILPKCKQHILFLYAFTGCDVCFFPTWEKYLNTLIYHSFIKATAKNRCVKLPSLPLLQILLLDTLKGYTCKFKHGSEKKYHQKNGVKNMSVEY
ncbi:hypothetical protein RN001_011713 [Aquatica leii]|uniref:Uncharacterized protein n=1 Tax=Aquatica leii TaxID=1421715 RepID=A0AAN7P4P6_9COLE|nr:hypothetical protein RN001_011713 [Aquatica leii]